METPTLTAYASHLDEASYWLTALLSDEPTANPAVKRGEPFTSYTPLPSLEPETGYDFTLEVAG
jgi:hypothetical protein